MQLNTIFFIGPQGSGKGTQAKILAQKLGFFHWEMGGILRSVAKEESELGRKIKNLIENGVLLSDKELYEVVDGRLAKISTSLGIIFDGIPRRVAQAKYLMDALIKQDRKDFTTIYISLPAEETMKRLMKRAEIEKRADDTKEKIQYRLELYKKDTLPVLDFLRLKTNFIEIDGRPDIQTVTKAIDNALNLI